VKTKKRRWDPVERFGWTAIPGEKVALARTYVAPHKRITKDGVEDVDGYWREVADTSNTPAGEKPANLDWAKKRWTSWAKKNATILEIYQGGEYEPMNGFLRSGTDEFAKTDVDQFKKALEDAPRTDKDAVVYRGGVGKVLTELGVEEGDTFTDPAFVSTSLTSSFAEGFGDDVVEIRMPKGSKGGYNVENGQEDFGEMEFILQAGTQFKIVSTEPWIMEVVVEG